MFLAAQPVFQQYPDQKNWAKHFQCSIVMQHIHIALQQSFIAFYKLLDNLETQITSGKVHSDRQYGNEFPRRSLPIVMPFGSATSGRF